MAETNETRRIDAAYRGHGLASWVLGAVVTVKIAQGLLLLFANDYVVRTADGIPLDAYSPAGAQTVRSVCALLGLDRLLFGALAIAVLVRYRGMIPAMFLLLLLNDVGRLLILQVFPIIRVGSPLGPTMNLVLLGLIIVGLALSLSRQGAVRAESVQRIS